MVMVDEVFTRWAEDMMGTLERSATLLELYRQASSRELEVFLQDHPRVVPMHEGLMLMVGRTPSRPDRPTGALEIGD